MKTIVFLLEEPSAREMLKALLPQLLPNEMNIKYLVFRGKQDLEKNIIRKVREWQLPDSRFLVLRDQDAGDCQVIKAKLVDLCGQSGKSNCIVRIACKELESFYLGDLKAVELGLKLKNLSAFQSKAKFRNPDHLTSPSMELESLTKRRYQKVSGSRAITPFMDINNNRSHSFRALVEGIKKLI